MEDPFCCVATFFSCTFPIIIRRRCKNSAFWEDCHI